MLCKCFVDYVKWIDVNGFGVAVVVGFSFRIHFSVDWNGAC